MKSTSLPRLTRTLLIRAESKGKAIGWYNLLIKGYLAEEISLYAEPTSLPNDIIHTVRTYSQRHNLPTPVQCSPKREFTRRSAPEDWRAAFRSSVMKTGMVLSLTQPMLEYLCAVADNVEWDRNNVRGSSAAQPCNSIATSSSLEKRGLIRRKSDRDMIQKKLGDSFYALTDAGSHVIELLKSVEVFIESDNAIERKNK